MNIDGEVVALNAGANNSEDDLAIITTQNGFGYRTDDHGSATGSATPMTIGTDSLEFVDEGIIERNTDVDYFSFETGAGNVSFTISPLGNRPNLDVWAGIYNSSGTLVADRAAVVPGWPRRHCTW